MKNENKDEDLFIQVQEGRFIHKGMILEAKSEDEARTKYQESLDFVEDPEFAKEMQLEYEMTQYQRDRLYPSAGEQSDMQYWDAINGTTIWLDTLTAIKAKFPKGE